MNYTINGLQLDTEKRTLLIGDDIKSIRPRTLKLLIYFISQENKIISKDELLSNVWSDVVVDEGVIFISIGEIRKLFDENKIIVNHPRKGYQFLGSVQQETIAETLPPEKKTRIIYSIAVLALILVLGFTFQQTGLFSDSELNAITLKEQRRILVMPIQNEISYEDRRWLKLGGMDHISSILKESSSAAYFYDTEETINIINAARVSAKNRPMGMNLIFDLSGATHVIETKFIGKSLEYTIAITVNSRTNSQKNILFAKSIEQGLMLTAMDILQQFDGFVEDINFELKKEFKHELFAEAILVYENDWESAISYFESYLNIEPNSVIAMMYLTRLYIWQNYPEKARQLVSRFSEIDDLSSEELAKVTYYKGQIEQRAKNSKLAIQYFEESAAQLNLQINSLLLARIHESIGEVLLHQNKDYPQALEKFNLAAEFYGSTGKIIGLTAVALKKARALYRLGEKDKAKRYLEESRTTIGEYNIEFLEIELEKSDALILQ